MPEGPEIRRAADRIQEQIAGRVIDQALVAGLGNYLRSEILFFTHLFASARSLDLTPNQQQSLAQGLGVTAVVR